MQIRVNRPINGLYPECQPEIGRIYEARSGPEPGRRQGIPFVIIDLPEKPNIVLREGEYEIVDKEEKPRGRPGRRDVDHGLVIEKIKEGKDDRAIAEELDICRETVRRIRKNEYREDTIMEEEKQETRLPEATAAPADPEVLLRELSAARRRITKLEQVILALTLERYA